MVGSIVKMQNNEVWDGKIRAFCNQSAALLYFESRSSNEHTDI